MNIGQNIINEWEKIKDFNIFQNIEEFSKLFEEKPNGVCFKKYTSYPWSKDNLFFGSYEELLTFYKTNLEVPFYLEKKIGEKFGQLTIKSFNIKLINNKKKIFANCLCECGKECEKDFNKMLEGHVKSCGNHKGQGKNNLLTLFPDIIKEHWDYDKNKDLPENVKITSNKEYWWIDDTGSFLLKPSELTKKQFGTSFHEQCIYYYCKQLFDTTKNRYRFKINNIITEADIYIPEINVAIEYDGVYWHKSKEGLDIEKTNRLNSQNIFLIRVREKGLNAINTTMTKTIICNFNDDNFHKTLNTIITTIANYVIENKIILEQDKVKHLSQFKLSNDTFEEDKLAILNQYRINYVNDNITKTCLIKHWDYDKNKAIIPQKVSVNDDIKVWFKCPYGFNKQLNVKLLAKETITHCKEHSNCLQCQSFYCPLWVKCVEHNSWKDYYNYQSVFTQLCPSVKKYFYYKLFVEKCLDGSNTYEQYVGKYLYENNNNLYSVEQIYKNHKEELLKNQELFTQTKKIFSSIILSTENFSSLAELKDFLINYKPVISNIKYEEFDKDDEYRKFLLDVLDHCEISPHIWENCKDKVSDELFNKIKSKVSHYSIELSTKIFTFEELQNLVKKYNPKISNVIFSDFSNSAKSRLFLINAISKIPYYNGIFTDWPFQYMPRWKIEQLKLIQKELNIKEIILDESNINDYIVVDWKQRKNLGRFGLTFKKKETDSSVKIDSLEIDFKENIKDKFFKHAKINSKKITPDIVNRYRHEFSFGCKNNPVFDECPFVLKNINGVVYIY